MKTQLGLASVALALLAFGTSGSSTSAQSRRTPAAPPAPPAIRGFELDTDRCFEHFDTAEGVMDLPIGVTYSRGGAGDITLFYVETVGAQARTRFTESIARFEVPGRRFLIGERRDDRGRSRGWSAHCVPLEPILLPGDFTFGPPHRASGGSRFVIREFTLSREALDRVADSLAERILFVGEDDAMAAWWGVDELLHPTTAHEVGTLR